VYLEVEGRKEEIRKGVCEGGKWKRHVIREGAKAQRH
jgi:hypothetical protein